jgi:deoxyribodipyrimidine photo-lyase
MDDIPAARGILPPARFDSALPTGLFVTSADLSLETQPLPPLSGVAATIRIGGSPAPAKRAFAETALADGAARAAAQAGVIAERLDEADSVAAMREWAARHGLRQIVTGEAPVGPVADRLAVATQVLAADGVQLVQLRRSWDAMAWPRATKGFFAFKGAIPSLLAL